MKSFPVIQSISRLRDTIVDIVAYTDESIRLYTEYYEYIEQLCYSFPIDFGIVTVDFAPYD